MDVALRLALARAVLRDETVWGYADGRGNRRGDALDLPAAVNAGVAYFGLPRDDVLAVDADSSAQTRRLQELARRLQDARITPVVVASGSPGHTHLFARPPDGNLETWKREARQAGLDLRDGHAGIRPPLTPHRDPSANVRLLAPGNPWEALAALTVDEQTIAGLSRRLRTLLATATPATPDSTRSGTLYTICLGLARRRWTWANALTAIRRAGGCAAALIAEKGEGWAHEHVWASAVARVAEDEDRDRRGVARQPQLPDPAIIEILGELWLAALADTWEGKDGQRALNLLRALVDAGVEQATDRPEVSYRDIHLRTGLHLSSVRTVAERLSERGWVAVARTGGPRWTHGEEQVVEHVEGTRWQLTVPPCSPCFSFPAPQMGNIPNKGGTPLAGTPGRLRVRGASEVGSRQLEARRDLVVAGALSLVVLDVVDAIVDAGDEGLASRDVAGLVGSPSRRSVAGLGRVVEQLGLVERTGAGRGVRWCASRVLVEDPEVAWTDAAQQAGVTGRWRFAKARIRAERADYRQGLEDTFTQRRETGDRRRRAWLDVHGHRRCGAATQAGRPCRRRVEDDAERCDLHDDRPLRRCGAWTRTTGQACRRPVNRGEERCSHHRGRASPMQESLEFVMPHHAAADGSSGPRVDMGGGAACVT